MALDLEEQEQIDEIKAWWDKNGKSLTSLIIAILVTFSAWQAYQYWNNKKATEASDLFQTLMTTELSKTAEIKSQTEKLIAQYNGTPYAGRAALLDAKAHYQAQDIDYASNQLKWAIANAKESSIQAMASIELAGILLEKKDYDGAKATLNAIKDKGFSGLKDNLLGDIALSQGDTATAKASFKAALEMLDKNGRFYQLTKQKLDSLGE